MAATQVTGLGRRAAVAGLAAGVAGGVAGRVGRAAAQGGPVKLGILTDMSSFGRDTNGPGTVQAVRMAVAEFGPTLLGRPIEVLVADHQEKVDVGAQIARKWFDEDGVRAIIDVPNSAIGIGVHNLAREKDRIVLLGGTFSSDVTNQLCSPNTVQFGLDTYCMGRVTADALAAEGAKTWFFITADFAFGTALQNDATAAITQGGGRVLGSAKHPVVASDFSSQLLAARSSGADVVALANSAGDTVNAIKQAAEFGMVGGKQKLAAFLMFDTNVHAIGLEAAQGVYAPIWSYWDTDEKTRAWSKTFFAEVKAMPTVAQVGSYSGTLAYLRAAQAAGSVETRAVMEKMRAFPLEDAFLHGAQVRADGRVIADVRLGRIKAPAQSKYPWDYIEMIRTIPGANAFRPVSESRCPLLKA